MRQVGWYLRSTVVWQKPSGAEPVRADRPVKSHEYVFLFAKSERYVTFPGEWKNHSVWKITQDRDSRHPAPFPRELARKCVEATSQAGDIVLDPFMGSGTVAEVCKSSGRNYIGCELNAAYLVDDSWLDVG